MQNLQPFYRNMTRFFLNIFMLVIFPNKWLCNISTTQRILKFEVSIIFVYSCTCNARVLQYTSRPRLNKNCSKHSYGDDNIHPMALSYQYVGDKYTREHKLMEITKSIFNIRAKCWRCKSTLQRARKVFRA
jgi:hypothetical protein